MNTNICEMLNIKYPIFQGGMAWVAEHNLVSAVSNAGGLGIIAAGGAPVEYVRDEIRKTRELTDNPFGVNIMMLSPSAEEIAYMVAEERVNVITTGAGNSEKYFEMWKEKGIKIIPVVASVALAKRVAKRGVDAVIAEGCESGGHIGNATTMTLVPQVVDAIDIPVIAAGGIGDGRGMAAAFMLGATAVQIGTRFLVADECIIHDNYKEKVINAKDIDSVVTGTTTGHPVRELRNKMTKEYIRLEHNGVGYEELEKMTLGSLRKAVVDGDRDNGSFMAGQIAGLISKRQSCEQIITEIVSEADKLLTNGE